MDIYWGTNENPMLSNLAPRKFSIKDKIYYSVEHCYQSWKSGKFDKVTYDKYLKYGEKAGVKIRGRFLPNGKNDLDLRIMKRIILESFKQDMKARELLLSTGDEILTHNRERGMWRTEFPRMLMEVREELRDENIL